MDSMEEYQSVLRSEIRFYRNVAEVQFTKTFSPDDANDIDTNVKAVCENEWGENKYDIFNVNGSEKCDILYFCDQNQCSVKPEQTPYERMIFTNSTKNTSIITNEIEHILVQSASNGFDIDFAYRNACNTVNALSYRIPFATSDEFGFITSNPLCAGTALKVNTLVHLPAITVSGKLNILVSKLEEMGAAVKCYFSEGNVPLGALYYITNSYTLGVTESETVECVKAATEFAVQMENECQISITDSNPLYFADIAWRALGTASLARVLTLHEFLLVMSGILIGCKYKIYDIDAELVDNLFLYGKQGYVERTMIRRSMQGENPDRVRAMIMREEIAPLLKKLL